MFDFLSVSFFLLNLISELNLYSVHHWCFVLMNLYRLSLCCLYRLCVRVCRRHVQSQLMLVLLPDPHMWWRHQSSVSQSLLEPHMWWRHQPRVSQSLPDPHMWWRHQSRVSQCLFNACHMRTAVSSMMMMILNWRQRLLVRRLAQLHQLRIIRPRLISTRSQSDCTADSYIVQCLVCLFCLCNDWSQNTSHSAVQMMLSTIGLESFRQNLTVIFVLSLSTVLCL